MEWSELNTLYFPTMCDAIDGRILVDNECTQRTSLNGPLSMSIDPFPQTHVYVLLAIRMFGDEHVLNEENILCDEVI